MPDVSLMTPSPSCVMSHIPPKADTLQSLQVKRTVKFITQQRIVDTSSDPPLREWSIEIYLLNPHGEQTSANIFEKVIYKLHETFEARQIQTFKRPPFKIKENGWGEFDMLITLTAVEKGGEFQIPHDLNFQQEKYESKHQIVRECELTCIVRAQIDMDKLAENLQRMSEDDLLLIVQMIHDKKTPETMTKNDVDQGEFHVDLYTLPDSLIRELWDFTVERLPGR
ncbi:MAG: hypothetical protein Q9163_003428 [Psora crenata]